MAKKYYAVRKGLTPGIYLTWADCQKNISGFPGAEYKGFDVIEEAAAFLEAGAESRRERKQGAADAVDLSGSLEEALGDSSGSLDIKLPGDLSGTSDTELPGEQAPAGLGLSTGQEFSGGQKPEAVAYVDGSYNVATGEYACGVVLFHKGHTEYFSRKFSDPERATMRNVAGEIEGSMCAMNYCLEREIPSLAIYYDYEGIEKWCTGAWKANKEGTIAYRDFYRKASQLVRIQFVKVKGHSGNKYNDLADKLAKQAIGIE